MSAQTANSQFSFQLPSMSYIDTSLEEPKLGVAAPAASHGIVAWLAGHVSALAQRSRQRNALSELSMMTDVELNDIGLNRGDLGRVFQPAFNADLMARGR